MIDTKQEVKSVIQDYIFCKLKEVSIPYDSESHDLTKGILAYALYELHESIMYDSKNMTNEEHRFYNYMLFYIKDMISFWFIEEGDE